MSVSPEVTIDLEFQPHQHDAMFADDPYVVLATGLGGGKSWSGARWILSRAVDFPRSIHLVTINSVPQAQDVVIPELDRAAEDMGLSVRWAAKRQRPTMFVDVGGIEAEVRVRSTFKAHTIRGPEYGSWWGDEVRDAEPEGLDTALDRLRCKMVDEPQYRLTTTTNGYDWVYKRHRKDATLIKTYPRNGREVKVWRRTDGQGTGYLLVQAPTDVNAHVRAGYAERISANHDAKRAAQERDAEFVTLGNRVYHAFDWERNVRKVAYIPGAAVIVCLDFNVEPCVCVIVQVIAGVPTVVDEIVIGGNGTPAVIATFVQRYPGVVPVIYGDSSGRDRSALGAESHYAQWQAAIPGVRFNVPMANGSVVDRVAAVNARLFNAQRQVGLIIGEHCHHTIADLDQVKWRDGTTDIDKRKKHLTHCSDALGYYIVWEYPCRRHLDRAALAAQDAGLSL